MACFVLREKGTERAFTGEFWDHHEKGAHRCAGRQPFLIRTQIRVRRLAELLPAR